MLSTRRTIGPVMTLIGVVMMSGGCESTDSSASLGAASENHPNFFVANRWIDDDNSGGASYEEFQNANKWMFRSDENITFVSRMEAEIGANVTWQLHAPNGDMIDQGDRTQRWESTWRRAYSGPVIDLLDQGGSGVWWVGWYINGIHAGESAAYLLP
ncbi:MAG: hypothetical protein O7G85_02415 [Planctomycetota bacterium]|nr:hypothetical protein [Planctomycetota bacterium]